MSKRYCVITASLEEVFFERVEKAREKTGQSKRQFVISALECYLKQLEQSDSEQNGCDKDA